MNEDAEILTEMGRGFYLAPLSSEELELVRRINEQVKECLTPDLRQDIMTVSHSVTGPVSLLRELERDPLARISSQVEGDKIDNRTVCAMCMFTPDGVASDHFDLLQERLCENDFMPVVVATVTYLWLATLMDEACDPLREYI